MIRRSSTATVAAALAAALLLGGCDKGPECGNGKVETGETCDKGSQNGAQGSNCSASCQLQNIATASVQTFYSRLKDEVPGFVGASCKDLGVKEAKIRLVGPTMVEETWPCSQNSKNFSPVTAGEYQFFATLYDDTGAALTNEIASEKKTVALPGSISLDLNFKYEDFLKQDYVGTYYFVPNWGADGTYCSAASVDKMQLKMTPKGSSTPVTNVTTPTVPLDGTSTACFSPGTPSFIKVADLTWGYYDLQIAGLGTASDILFCKKLAAFVGPGVGTPTCDVVVDAATTCP